jgi:hypothetical protein
MSEAYESDSFIVAYLKWHYTKAVAELIAVFENFLWFIAHFFSFKLLLKTIFMPWKRLGESYGGGFNLEAFTTAFVVNTIMRAVGFATKVVILVVGGVAWMIVFVFGIFFFLLWLVMPAVIIGSLVLTITFFLI